jgi:hypothetical protein
VADDLAFNFANAESATKGDADHVKMDTLQTSLDTKPLAIVLNEMLAIDHTVVSDLAHLPSLPHLHADFLLA